MAYALLLPMFKTLWIRSALAASSASNTWCFCCLLYLNNLKKVLAHLAWKQIRSKSNQSKTVIHSKELSFRLNQKTRKSKIENLLVCSHKESSQMCVVFLLCQRNHRLNKETVFKISIVIFCIQLISSSFFFPKKLSFSLLKHLKNSKVG